MRTKENHKSLANLLLGNTRRAVLGLLYMNSEESYHTRGVARQTGLSAGTVHRELKALQNAGLIECAFRHGRPTYQANKLSPIYGELRAIILKTVGLAEPLQQALEPLRKKIVLAFVYGSLAAGSDRASSDIDLMVIGDVTLAECVRVLGPSQDILGREVNPAVFPESEFRTKLAGDDYFLRNVMVSSKIFLIGGEDELRRLAAGRLDRPA